MSYAFNNSETFAAIALAREWYSKKKFEHCLRVAEYAVSMGNEQKYSENELTLLFIIGLLHDILEDTKCPEETLEKIFDDYVVDAIKLLTKDKSMSYHEYCQNIIYSPSILAFLVKRADLKDHLTRRDTLTDELKEKYVMEVGDFL